MRPSPIEEIEGPLTVPDQGQSKADTDATMQRGTAFVFANWRAGCEMLPEFQTKPECPYGTTGNEAVGKASDSPPPASDAVRQQETDLIMEALVREYWDSRSRRN